MSIFDVAFNLAWLVPLFPFLAFAAILLFTYRNHRLSHQLAIGGIAVSTVLAQIVFWTAVLMPVGGGERAFESARVPWLPLGLEVFSLGVYVDPATAIMLFMVPLVCLMIFIYSVGYMHGDPRYSRFFAYISLFAAGMLGLIVFNNLLAFFLFWEIMGTCSYLLIGFWYEKKSAAQAGLKAFLVTKVGDLFFMLGLALLYAETGSLAYRDVFSPQTLEHLAHTGFLGTQFPAAAVIALLFFGGTVGKSAQFPLHVWLPDAMEGPTPVSALVHAATMVSAGVFLVVRTFPLFAAVEGGLQMTIVAAVGAFTAIFASLIAVAQNDVKRVLAFSTISQLGYMVAALGLGAYAAGAFHLITHAFFKALLFLGSGSVIHAMKVGQAFQPADVGQPSQPADVGQPSQPANVGQAFQPAHEPANVGQAFQPANVGQPSQPANVRQPSQPANVRQPSQPADVRQPSQPANVRQPSQPANVGQPSQPANVRQPFQPANVGQAFQPANVGQPSQPANVGQPSQPADVGQPSQPTDVGQAFQPAHEPAQFNPNDMTNMGGLARPLRRTFWTFLIGGLALAGFPLTAGFWSKDEILAQAYASSPAIFWILAVAAGLTAFYTARQVCLTFLGQPRTAAAEHAPESVPAMTVPLIVLAVFAVGLGWAGIPEHFPGLGGRIPNWFHGFVGTTLETAHTAQPTAEAAPGFAWQPLALGLAFALGGLALGWLVYGWKPVQAGEMDRLERAMRKVWLGWLYDAMRERFYCDRIYQVTFVRGSILLADLFHAFDRRAVDGLVNLAGRVSQAISRASGRFDVHVVDALVNLAGRAGRGLSQATGVFDVRVLDRLVDLAGPVTRTLADLAASVDVRVIDSTVNSVGDAVLIGGRFIRPIQTGKVQNYLLLASLMVLALIVTFFMILFLHI